MSLYDAQDYVDKASRIPSIEWISLTGGEPMLHPSLVEGIVAYASGSGHQDGVSHELFLGNDAREGL